MVGRFHIYCMVHLKANRYIILNMLHCIDIEITGKADIHILPISKV